MTPEAAILVLSAAHYRLRDEARVSFVLFHFSLPRLLRFSFFFLLILSVPCFPVCRRSLAVLFRHCSLFNTGNSITVLEVFLRNGPKKRSDFE